MKLWISIAVVLFAVIWLSFFLYDSQTSYGVGVSDKSLKVQTIAKGISSPTSMTFIDSKNILVLEKNTGKARLISNGVLRPSPVLNFSVNTDSERGLLGAATYKSTNSGKTFVFLYYTEEQQGQDLRNRVYRFEWNGSVLENPLLMLDLPALPGPNHDGGKLLIGTDRNLYVVIGDVNHKGKLQNVEDGPDPDDTGVIFRINPESFSVASKTNPFSPSQTVDLQSRYVAYGIRNSFGLAMDPLTGRLWETENGPDKYDEINYIRNSDSSGFNGGWRKVMGPISRSTITPDQLVNFQNFKYYDPVFSWKKPVAVTGIDFFHSSKLGSKYKDNLFVGDYNNGNLYFFKINDKRSGLSFSSSQKKLKDLVVDSNSELSKIKFGTGFNGITDVKMGPDGLLYVLSINGGTLYRVGPK